MGLFSFLKNGKPSYSDKVWLTRNEALKGIMTEGLRALTHGEVPVLLSFFDDRQQEVIAFAKEKNVPYHILEANSLERNDKSVLLMNAQWLSVSAPAMDFLLQQAGASSVNLLFYGHYPIPVKENELLSKIAVSINQKNKIKFFSSLDDRAFEMFGAGNIKNIMEKMGLKEDEAIEHAMVTKAMVRAREKIAAGVPHEITAATESAWYQKNYNG